LCQAFCNTRILNLFEFKKNYSNDVCVKKKRKLSYSSLLFFSQPAQPIIFPFFLSPLFFLSSSAHSPARPIGQLQPNSPPLPTPHSLSDGRASPVRPVAHLPPPCLLPLCPSAARLPPPPRLALNADITPLVFPFCFSFLGQRQPHVKAINGRPPSSSASHCGRSISPLPRPIKGAPELPPPLSALRTPLPSLPRLTAPPSCSEHRCRHRSAASLPFRRPQPPSKLCVVVRIITDLFPLLSRSLLLGITRRS